MEQGKISVLIDEDTLQHRIQEIAEEINKEFAGSSVKLLCILKGSIFFTCELAKRLTVPVTIDFMQVSSYGSKTVSSGEVCIKKDLDEAIAGQNVILIEDIIDSGRTLSKLIPILEARQPKLLKICTLLDKPDRRETQISVDYNGFVIPDEFVVGYGLDYDQQYRNLPYIGVVKQESEDIEGGENEQ